jgi:hypothetical protein
MFPGFFIGTVCLFMLVRTVFGGHRYGFGRRWAAYGPGRGRHAYDRTEWLWGDDPWDDIPRRQPSVEHDAPRTARRVEDAIQGFLRTLRDKLGASPEQERAFTAAVERLREASKDFQDRMNEAREDLSRAVRYDAFNEPAFDAASQHFDQAVQAMRAAIREVLAGVYAVLDAGQREMLANLIWTT